MQGGCSIPLGRSMNACTAGGAPGKAPGSGTSTSRHSSEARMAAAGALYASSVAAPTVFHSHNAGEAATTRGGAAGVLDAASTWP